MLKLKCSRIEIATKKKVTLRHLQVKWTGARKNNSNIDIKK